MRLPSLLHQKISPTFCPFAHQRIELWMTQIEGGSIEEGRCNQDGLPGFENIKYFKNGPPSH
jgi:hypothetical protein